jgi:hypothetical protein
MSAWIMLVLLQGETCFCFLTVLVNVFIRQVDLLMKGVGRDYVIMNHFTRRLK